MASKNLDQSRNRTRLSTDTLLCISRLLGCNIIRALIATHRQIGSLSLPYGDHLHTNRRFSLMLPSETSSTDLLPAQAMAALSPVMRAIFPRRFWFATWVGCLLLIVSGASFAATDRALFTPCIACHGNKGEGNATLNAPAIAGQDAAYIERQLRNFRSNRRGAHKSDAPGAQMRAMAATLADDAAVARVAAYVSALPKTVSATIASGDLRNGNNLYHGKCGACHGGAAEGNASLKSPRLAGLDGTYIKRQFTYFRDGVRGTDPQDIPGRQMAMMAKTLQTDRDLEDVIAFIHQQGRPK